MASEQKMWKELCSYHWERKQLEYIIRTHKELQVKKDWEQIYHKLRRQGIKILWNTNCKWIFISYTEPMVFARATLRWSCCARIVSACFGNLLGIRALWRVTPRFAIESRQPKKNLWSKSPHIYSCLIFPFEFFVHITPLPSSLNSGGACFSRWRLNQIL